MDQKMGMVVLAIICGIILLVLLLRKRAQMIFIVFLSQTNMFFQQILQLMSV